MSGTISRRPQAFQRTPLQWKRAPVPEGEVGHVHGITPGFAGSGRKHLRKAYAFSRSPRPPLQEGASPTPRLGAAGSVHSVNDRRNHVPGSIPIPCLYNGRPQPRRRQCQLRPRQDDLNSFCDLSMCPNGARRRLQGEVRKRLSSTGRMDKTPELTAKRSAKPVQLGEAIGSYSGGSGSLLRQSRCRPRQKERICFPSAPSLSTGTAR
jgi:hypothetical protein